MTRPLSRFASTAVPPPLWENCLNLSDILLLYVSEIVRFDAVIHRTLVDISLPRDCIEARQCVMVLREKIVSVLKFGISAQYSHFFQLAADDGLVNLPIMILYRIPKKTLHQKVQAILIAIINAIIAMSKLTQSQHCTVPPH